MNPGTHLGGMVSSGLGHTDGSPSGGISQEFFTRVGGLQFVPSAAERVFDDMVANESRIRVYAGCQVAAVTAVAPDGVAGGGPRILSFDTTSGGKVGARVFVDATYEGDLMAMSNVSYFVGREAAADFNETAAGRQAEPPLWPCAANWNWGPVDGTNQSTGLPLPMVSSGPEAALGEGDSAVQAYGFRLCMTRNDSGAAFAPMPAPSDYRAPDWELLRRAVSGTEARLGMFFQLTEVGGGKTDTNNGGGLATDMVGGSQDWPDGNYSRRAEIFAAHKEYTLGLFHFLRTDPAVPAALKAELAPWGLCGDEFTDTGNWPHQLYVREARRMRGPFVFTQADRVVDKAKADSIAVGAYNLDAHVCRRVIVPGSDDVTNEGCLSGFAKYNHLALGEYEIPYRVLLPPAAQSTNLLVTAAVSATHVGFATLRMEPQFMNMGEAAGAAAHLVATGNASSVQGVAAGVLRALLRRQGVQTNMKPSPPPSPPTFACGLGRCVADPGAGPFPSATCGGACSPLGRHEWLGSTSAWLLAPHNGTATALKPTHLKKSTAPSDTLPAAEVRSVQTGTVCLLNVSGPASWDRLFACTLPG